MSQQCGSTKVDVGSEFLRLSLEQELEIKYQLEGPRRLYQFAHPQRIWGAGLVRVSVCKADTCKLHRALNLNLYSVSILAYSANK